MPQHAKRGSFREGGGCVILAAMLRTKTDPAMKSPPSPVFLPLAFRFAASSGLLILHLAFPTEAPEGVRGEAFYLACLALLLGESAWEMARNLGAGLKAFSAPSHPWIRWNLALDLVLVTLLIAFQGVDQERFVTLYIIPVLAAAFYLSTSEIIAMGALAIAAHGTSLLLFSSGILPRFGYSAALGMAWGERGQILALSALQVLPATLVVVAIRKYLEQLRTNLAASEEAAQDLTALYGRVVESMFSGLITTDLTGRITSANPAAEQILHRRLEPGEPVEGVLPVDLAGIAHSGREHRFEGRFLTPEGEVRTFGGNVAPLKGSDGQQTGHLVLFQDLTELKALEQRTRISERLAAVGELSAGLAHELRNPLASILGCVQLLRKGNQGLEMTERILTILGREGERVSGILSSFLDVSRPRDIAVRPLHLPTLVAELRSSWEMDPRTEGMPLVIGPVPKVWILGDPLCFHQVFTNLLSNARKAVAGAEAPTILITFDTDDQGLQVQVGDNGTGMDAEQMATLFVPFASGFREGTGLGMSLVYQFVQQMGWDIQVESAPAEGTVVTLLVPLAAGALPEGA
jgi:two-component system sensor histidine kinase PilS (NtrC family)